MRLVHLIYISESAMSQAVDDELARIHTTSRFLNSKVSVTGLLLYNAGQFLQVLEGEEVVVDRLFQKIERDPRHTSVTKLIAEPIGRRLFADWHMGVMNLEHGSDFEQQRFVDLVRVCRTAPQNRLVATIFKEFRKQLTKQRPESAALPASAIVKSFRETYNQVATTLSEPME